MRLSEFALGELDPSLAPIIGGRIPWDFPGSYAEFLQDKVASGEMSAIAIKRGEKTVAGIVYELTEEKELVMVALAGITAYDGLTAEVDNLAQALARKIGATSIRFHTQRATVAEAAIQQGYHISELVLRKVVEG